MSAEESPSVSTKDSSSSPRPPSLSSSSSLTSSPSSGVKQHENKILTSNIVIKTSAVGTTSPISPNHSPLVTNISCSSNEISAEIKELPVTFQEPERQLATSRICPDVLTEQQLPISSSYDQDLELFCQGSSVCVDNDEKTTVLARFFPKENKASDSCSTLSILKDTEVCPGELNPCHGDVSYFLPSFERQNEDTKHDLIESQTSGSVLNFQVVGTGDRNCRELAMVKDDDNFSSRKNENSENVSEAFQVYGEVGNRRNSEVFDGSVSTVFGGGCTPDNDPEYSMLKFAVFEVQDLTDELKRLKNLLDCLSEVEYVEELDGQKSQDKEKESLVQKCGVVTCSEGLSITNKNCERQENNSPSKNLETNSNSIGYNIHTDCESENSSDNFQFSSSVSTDAMKYTSHSVENGKDQVETIIGPVEATLKSCKINQLTEDRQHLNHFNSSKIATQ